ncbi:liver carboxylesterase-like [Balamuthia mandrillaris]
MVSLLTALVSSAFTGTPSLEALVAMEGALLYAAGCFAVLVVLYFMLTWVMEAGHQRHGIKHPVHVLDLAHALKWVHDNVESYGGDSNNIFLSGHSAGGHLVTLLSLKPDYLEKAGHSKDLLRCVKGVISLSGVFHLGRLKKNIITRHWYLTPAFGKDPAVYREASPITWAKQRTRFPFLLLNAASDFHLHRDSTELAAVLREAGSKVTVCSVPKTNHRSIVSLIHSPKDQVTPLLLAFIFQREDQLEKMVQSSSSSPKEDEKKDKESQTKKRKKEQ